MNELMSVIEAYWQLILPFVIIQLILIVVAIVDLVRAERTNGSKWIWLLVILFVNILGPIIYFIIGRRNS